MTEFKDRKLILLSGPIAVGKSTFSEALINDYGFSKISTGSFLFKLAESKGLSNNRTGLQKLGDNLDIDTNFRWVVDVAERVLDDKPSQKLWLFDSVRKKEQVDHFKGAALAETVHIFLTAPENILRDRYSKRLHAGGEYDGNSPYEIAATHPNEMTARKLILSADHVIDVSEITPEQAASDFIEYLRQLEF